MTHRESIWYSFLDAQMAVCYWGRLARRCKFWDKFTKIILLLTSTSAFATFLALADNVILLGCFLVISALLAASLPIIDWPARLLEFAVLQGEWIQVAADYQELWLSIDSMQESETEQAWSRIRVRENELGKREGLLPYTKKRNREYCTRQVLENVEVRYNISKGELSS